MLSAAIPKSRPMPFADYIRNLPSDTVYHHLPKEMTGGRKIISTSWIKAVCEKFTDEKAAGERFHALSRQGRLLCSLAYLFGGGGIGGEIDRQVREELLRSFLVYSVSDAEGRRYLVGFDDLEKPLHRLVLDVLGAEIRKREQAQPAGFWLLRCLNDVVVCATMAVRNRLKKTRKGALTRGAYQELKRVLIGTKATCVFRSVEADRSAVCDLLLAYGLTHGIMVDQNHQYASSHALLDRYTAQPIQELWEEFFRFTVEYSGAWRHGLLEELLGRGDGGWLTTGIIPESARTRALFGLHALHYTGYMDAIGTREGIFFGPSGAERRRAISEASGAERDGVIVSPDFTVILPQESLPGTLYTFSCVGTISQFDCIYRGVIDRETVCDSLSRGISGEVLLGYLRRWGAPENVVSTVHEWIREFSRLYVCRGEMIAAFDERTARQLNSFKSLGDVIEPLRAHAVFKIRTGREKEAAAVLKTMGYDTRMPQEESLGVHTAPAAIDAEGESLVPDYEFSDRREPEDEHSILTGKYGPELKQLESNDLFQVVDFAILMGYLLTFEYGGSRYIKRGLYRIRPSAVHKANPSTLEGEVPTTKKIKTFYIEKIRRIGVLPP